MRSFFASIIVLTSIVVHYEVQAAEYDEVHECDTYASHPNDPNRWSQGVSDEEIIPGPAIKFCKEAVDDYDDTPRFKFQLGRALWAGYKLEEGLKEFLELEEEFEYGPVYAYLGDAYMHGIGGAEVDEELAISLYQIADEAGFAPAGEVLVALSGDEDANTAEQVQPTSVETSTLRQPLQPSTPQPAVEAKTIRPFNPEVYFEKKIVSGLYHGDLSKVRLGNTKYFKADKSYFYLSGFLKPFQENYNYRDESCIYLSNPTLSRIINTEMARSIPGVGGLIVGNGRSLEDNLNAGGAAGWQMMGDLLKGLHSGQGFAGSDYGQVGIETNILAEHGDKDSRKLIAQHGCGSPITQQIFANLSYFVTGQGQLQVSEEEKQRQEKKKIAEAKRQETKRQKALRTSAQNSCQSEFKKTAFCSCLVEGLDERNIQEAEWKRLGSNFREVLKIGKQYEGFSGHVKTCRSKS